MMAYLVISFIYHVSLVLCSAGFPTCWRKTKPANNANIVRLITPRSVLLSTKTRNAHIPLINHNNKYIHHNANVRLALLEVFSLLLSVICGEKYSITLRRAHSPKRSENGPDKKFITTATVSGARVNHGDNGFIRLNR
jgi:hypothetical protein